MNNKHKIPTFYLVFAVKEKSLLCHNLLKSKSQFDSRPKCFGAKNMFCLIWSKGIKIFPKWSQMLDWLYGTIFDRVWPLWEVCHVWPNGCVYLLMIQPNCNYKTKTEYVVFNNALIISMYTKSMFRSEQGIILSLSSTHHDKKKREKNWIIFYLRCQLYDP